MAPLLKVPTCGFGRTGAQPGAEQLNPGPVLRQSKNKTTSEAKVVRARLFFTAHFVLHTLQRSFLRSTPVGLHIE